MRNKSRKRILHEQRVQIEELRRELAAHKQAQRPAILAQYDPQKIEIVQYIALPLRERAIVDAKRRADREATQQIIEALARSEIIERIETEQEHSTEVRYRLIVMKRRYC